MQSNGLEIYVYILQGRLIIATNLPNQALLHYLINEDVLIDIK